MRIERSVSISRNNDVHQSIVTSSALCFRLLFPLASLKFGNSFDCQTFFLCRDKFSISLPKNSNLFLS